VLDVDEDVFLAKKLINMRVCYRVGLAGILEGRRQGFIEKFGRNITCHAAPIHKKWGEACG
jgi:hypothetical protein